MTNMVQANPSHVRLLSDEDLDREFASGDHDEAIRDAILYEKIRRVSLRGFRPHWLNWATLLVALLGAILAGMAAWPVVSEMVEKEWLDF